MPVTKPLLKVIVPVVSLLLLSGFVAYRSGAFDKFIGSTVNGSTNDLSYASDTSSKPKVDTTKPRKIMSSSKSIILIDDKTKPVLSDSNQKTFNKDTIKANADSIKPTIFYGSKSGGIIRPSDVDKLKVKDTLKNKKNNDNQ